MASFLYPTNNPTINNIDTLDVTYVTPWSGANLTVFCLVNSAQNTYSFYQANNPSMRANPPFLKCHVNSPPLAVDPSGTYILPDVSNGIANLNQYPVVCHLQLTEYQNSTDFINGGLFTLTSTGGSPSTYQQSTTSSASGTASSGATATTTSINAPTTTQSQTGSRSAGQVTATSTPTPFSTPVVSSGLSTGAKAGIGIGAAVGALALIGLLAWLFMSRRRKSARNLPNAETGAPYTRPEKDHMQYNAAAHPPPHYEPVSQQQPIYESGGRAVPPELGIGQEVPVRHELQ